MKSWHTRWDETIDYLNRTFPGRGLGDHINSVVTQNKIRESISKELSIGKNPGKDGEDDPSVKSTPDQRHALRGLLLCQRVYFSDLWAKKTFSPGNIVEDKWSLDLKTWKATSQKFWGGKSEKDIQQGIAMFLTNEKATLDSVVSSAKKSAPNGTEVLPGNLTLSRSDKVIRGAAETCYNGIIAWLLHSGIVSLRWVMLDTSPNGEAACKRLFGDGKIVWDGNTPFEPESKLPVPKAGYICHMWVTESGVAGWNGHWVISNGDGTICGVNNGEVDRDGERVLKKYTNSGKLRTQFEGYGGPLTKNDERGVPQRVGDKFTHAFLVQFNPLKLPGRI